MFVHFGPCQVSPPESSLFHLNPLLSLLRLYKVRNFSSDARIAVYFFISLVIEIGMEGLSLLAAALIYQKKFKPNTLLLSSEEDILDFYQKKKEDVYGK